MSYWSFNPDTCKFDRVHREALADAVVAIICEENWTVSVVRDQGPPQRWQLGDPLVVAGIEFDREDFVCP